MRVRKTSKIFGVKAPFSQIRSHVTREETAEELDLLVLNVVANNWRLLFAVRNK